MDAINAHNKHLNVHGRNFKQIVLRNENFHNFTKLTPCWDEAILGDLRCP